MISLLISKRSLRPSWTCELTWGHDRLALEHLIYRGCIAVDYDQSFSYHHLFCVHHHDSRDAAVDCATSLVAICYHSVPSLA